MPANGCHHIHYRTSQMSTQWGSYLLLLVACRLFTVDGDRALSRVVNTKYGKIQGTIRHHSRPALRPIEVFLGIPYASAPVRQGRFTPTSSPPPWDHIRKCDRLPAVCPQPLWDGNQKDSKTISPELAEYFKWHKPILQNQNEDCLYLNIYAPHDGGGNYPVLVYIHGGSFSWGSGNLYDGGTLAAYGQLIVVMVNYRLGPLGFLNTSPEGKRTGVVSNQGIMDQLAAVTWVKENIATFGGDSNQITLAGHSTGAVCIGYLLASPVVVPGLFHQVVLMSGSPFSPWSEVPNPLSVTVRLAKMVGCTVPSDLNRRHPEMMACLRNVSAHHLVMAPMPDYKFASVYGPSVDGIVITQDFNDRLRRTIANRNITLLFGVSERDAFVELNAKQTKSGFDMSERNRIFRTFVRNTYRYHLQEIYLSISKEYTNWANPSHHPIEVRDLTVAALSDGAYLAPLIRFADTVSSRSKSFMYVFTQANREQTSHPYLTEVSLLFGRPFDDHVEYGGSQQMSQSANPLVTSSSNYSRSDALVSEYLMRYFVNFAKTGDPNSPDVIVPMFTSNQRFISSNTTWEQYDPIFEKYMDISTRPRCRNHYRAHKVALWNWLLPELEETGSKYPDTKSERWHKSDDQKYFIGPVRPLDPYRFMKPTPPVQVLRQQPQAESSLDSYLTPNVSAAQGSSSRKNNVSSDPQLYNPSLLDYTTALTLTVAIGLSLLVLNVILFGALLYKREKSANQQLKYDSISSQPLCTLDSGLRSTPTASDCASTDKEIRLSCSPSDSYNIILQTFPTVTDIGDITTELQCKSSPQSILNPTSQFIPPPPLLSTTPPSTPYLSIVSSEDCTNFDKIKYITDIIPHSSSYQSNAFKDEATKQAQPVADNNQAPLKAPTNINPHQCRDDHAIQNRCVCSCEQGCESPIQYCPQQCTVPQCELNKDVGSGSKYNDCIPTVITSEANKFFAEKSKNLSYTGGKASTLRLGQITALNTRYNSENRVPKKEQAEQTRSTSSYATLPCQGSRVIKSLKS